MRENRILYRQTVDVTRYTGRDDYGQATYGAPVVYRCRIAGNRRLFTNDKGEEVIATHDIWFLENPTLGELDIVTLSTGFVHSTESGVRQPAITSVGHYPDDRGNVYVVAHANLRYLGF